MSYLNLDTVCYIISLSHSVVDSGEEAWNGMRGIDENGKSMGDELMFIVYGNEKVVIENKRNKKYIWI